MGDQTSFTSASSSGSGHLGLGGPSSSAEAFREGTLPDRSRPRLRQRARAGSEAEIFRATGRTTRRGSAVHGSGQRRMAEPSLGALCIRLARHRARVNAAA